MNLYYNDQYRTETDESVINNLLRKGWRECPTLPVWNPENQHSPIWNPENQHWTVEDFTEDEIINNRKSKYPPVSKLQIKIWLSRNNIDPNQITTIINQVVIDEQQNKEAQIRWAECTTIDRDNELVNVICSILEISSEQLDSQWNDILNI